MSEPPLGTVVGLLIGREQNAGLFPIGYHLCILYFDMFMDVYSNNINDADVEK